MGYETAKLSLVDAFYGPETKLGSEDPHTTESREQLVTLYQTWPKPGEAQKWRAKLPQDDRIGE